MSHPSWVCGLKLAFDRIGVKMSRHTLRGGVDWNNLIMRSDWLVRSHTLRGCVDWNPDDDARDIRSHTLRGCVDWNWRFSMMYVLSFSVTPFVGVWIETRPWARWHDGRGSHPSWVCGLKRSSNAAANTSRCHTLRGCVDWNLRTSRQVCWRFRHTLRGCVDWNWDRMRINVERIRHTLRGCVDWNFVYGNWQRRYGVTPFVGVWIETLRRKTLWRQYIRHTLRGCVDWNLRKNQ